MANALLIDAGTVGVRGEYKVATRTSDNNVVAESAWAKNTITLQGFAQFLGNTAKNAVGQVGVGNTPATESDTSLESRIGPAVSSSTVTRTAYTTPDEDGYMRLELVYKWTWNPGDIAGTTPYNLAEAGVGTVAGTGPSTTPVLSRGLLVDNDGLPVTVAYKPDQEWLDLYWKVTFYVKDDVSGVLTVDDHGTPTEYAYRVFPKNFANEAFAISSPTSNTSHGLPYIFATPAYSEYAGFTNTGWDSTTTSISLTGGYRCSLLTMAPFTAGDKHRDFTMRWNPTYGNPAGGMASIVYGAYYNLAGIGSCTIPFVCEFTPKFSSKVPNVDKLELTFRLSYANK